MNVNLKHHFFCAQAGIARMRKKDAEAIVKVGSISWHRLALLLESVNSRLMTLHIYFVGAGRL